MNKFEKAINTDAADWIGGHPGMTLNLKEFYIFFRW